MTDYTVGFAFNPSRSHFIAIDKLRGPKGVVGRINGVGGHVEPGEEPHDTQVREFLEETGVQTEAKDWYMFALLVGADFEVYVYRTVLTAEQFAACKSMTDECVCALSSTDLHPRAVRNLPFLIPAALMADEPGSDLFSLTVEYAA
jgi:8-oxo-dGTP diphosphatase